MKKLKNKLSSKSGASMLLALVFLMFCMFVGGSVLAAATANGSRAARQKENQQAYLSQRSASLLLADLLKGDENSAMQLTIKYVDDGTKTVTFMAHGSEVKTNMQRLMYELAIAKYMKENNITFTGNNAVFPKYVNFNFPKNITSTNYAFSDPGSTGSITISIPLSENKTETITAWYSADSDGDFSIGYTNPGEDKEKTAEELTPAVAQGHSYVTIAMKCYYDEGKAVTVNGVTTKTSIIRWDDPVIEKGGK